MTVNSDLNIDVHVEKILADCKPLTEEQRVRFAELLRPVSAASE
jgi:hypothetical protein